MAEGDITKVREALTAAGHGAARHEGHGAYLPVFSFGFWPRPSLDGRDVEILHLGSEADDAVHEGWLLRYEAVLQSLGAVGRRRLGAGRECVTFTPS